MATARIAASPDRGRAAALVERMTFALIGAAAARRQRHGGRHGDRAPAGLAQPARRAQVLTERVIEDGKPAEAAVTPKGYTTAVRVLPPVLAGLDPSDPRRRAAVMIADAVERIGSIGGADPAGGDTKGGVSDGGATTRVKHAARLRLVEVAANRWPPAAIRSTRHKGPARVVMAVRRRRGSAKEITATALLHAVCVDGLDMAQVLHRHGWSAHGKHRRALTEATLETLQDVAASLGLA